MPKTIIIGTAYNIFHEEFATDQEFFSQVDRDISLMKASHVNHVMVFPMSQWDPVTKQLLWTRTDYLIKKIEEARMKFVPLMLKEEQCSHFFPFWKFKEIKGMWEEYDLKNGNKNNRENVDFADPRVYPLVEDYFKAVIGRYAKSPALSFYNIWNEPHYSSDAGHVIERFHKWLQERYGTLSALRRAWGKEYSNWDEVTPFLNDNWNSSMPQIDWITFRNELNGVLLGELIKTLRKYDSTHPVNANSVGTPWATFSNFGSYNIDDLPIADHNDIHGISYYPDIWERDHNLEPMPFWLHNLTFNTVRCAAGEKDYILTEAYTNPQNGLALNGYLNKDFVTLLAWTALANDCKGMIYWKWLPFMRGRQSLGRGLCRIDGQLAPSGEAVRDIGSFMDRYGEKLYQARLKKPPVAVLVDLLGLLKTLEQTTEMSTNKFMYESNAGLFKALYEGNITADFLRMDHTLTLKTLRSYKIIYLPFQIVMRRRVADLLKEYVRQGGWVVADARTATIDELDYAYHTSPGAGLDELFGAVRPEWVGRKTYYKIRMKRQRSDGSFRFEGRYFRDHLVLRNNVRVIGTFEDDSEPAVIENHYGKGTAILSAVPLGASYYDRPGNRVNRLILDLASEAGVVADAGFISDNHSFVSLKVHTLDNNVIIYLINSEDFPKSGTLEVNVGDLEVKSVKDILSNRNYSFKQKEGRLSVLVKVRGNQVSVFFVE